MGMLDGKVVLITGASSGIGEATAHEAAAEGAQLLLCDVDDDRGQALAETLGATYAHCDVVDEQEVAAMVDACVSAYGRIDGAFNCAGILGGLGMTADAALADWKRIIDVDLTGVFLCTKHQLKQMVPAGSGSIVNMSSAAGLIGWAGAVGYVAAKHGVVGLSKAAAMDYAPQGIRVNALCPSYIETPLVKDMFENLLGGDQAAVDAAIAVHPYGRFGKASEVAAACVWLLSDKASLVTGTAFSVDGGYTTQ
jgi:NAD(P)-dependent dehydrogenase (short-subunit alcohol dehydrogenase family)